MGLVFEKASSSTLVCKATGKEKEAKWQRHTEYGAELSYDFSNNESCKLSWRLIEVDYTLK